MIVLSLPANVNVDGSVSNRMIARVCSVSPWDESIMNVDPPIGGSPKMVVSTMIASIVVSCSVIACSGHNNGHDFPASSFSAQPITAIAATADSSEYLL